MKKRILTIKAKVTLWYTIMASAMVVVLLTILLASVTDATNAYYESLLTQAMTDASEQVSYRNGSPQLRRDAIADFDKVSFALMTNAHNLWAGQWPMFDAPFEDGSVRRAEANGHTWLYQDLLLPFPEGDLWLRGYLALDSMRFMRDALQIRMYYLMPALLLLASVGGYLLTRRSFRPISQMARKADGIAGGQDLSQRFALPNARRLDEFGELAQTFNNMFDRLEDSFQRERQFTDDASHELRTPITVIRSACDFALSQDDPAEWREALEVVRAKADGMSDMVLQLLQLARMDAGRVTLAREQVDLSVLCMSVADELAAPGGKPVDLSAVSQGVIIQGDELLLMRLVINILENALRFAKTRVNLSLTNNGGEILLSIADDGPGMTQEVAERIFDRFYQAEPDRNAQKPGAGLGLCMAREIARLHGARISVRTAPGKGTEMSVTFNEKNS